MVNVQFRYATIYTMFPVFSLVLDKDVLSKIALTYPELYKELSKGRSLSYKTFFIWVLISIYQGNIKFILIIIILFIYVIYFYRWCNNVWGIVFIRR